MVHLPGDATLPDVQIHLHEIDGSARRKVGVGVTDTHGEFDCIRADGTGALQLPQGEYAVTLESVGPTPLVWPVEYTDPARTPIRLSWPPGGVLELEIPEPLAGH